MHQSLRSRSTVVLSLASWLLLAAGCVAPTWVADEKPQTAIQIGVTSDLPAGWSRFTPDKDLVMTRDGFILQSIRVSRVKYGAKLPQTDRTISKGIEPQEAAQILIDSMAADQGRHHLQIVSNRPATVDGRPGFRVEVKFRTPEGLTVHETFYVAFVDESYVVARFSAPDRHYYELHEGTFEKVVQSLKIQPASKNRS